MKKFLLAAVTAVVAVIPLSSQSNLILDEILAEEELTAASAAYLILSTTGGGEAPQTRGEAFEKLKESFSEPGDTVTSGEFAFLLQNHFDLPRGLFSLLFPGPRYALRDLRFLQIIQEKSHPNTTLSGERAVRILGRVLAEKEERL